MKTMGDTGKLPTLLGGQNVSHIQRKKEHGFGATHQTNYSCLLRDWVLHIETYPTFISPYIELLSRAINVSFSYV